MVLLVPASATAGLTCPVPRAEALTYARSVLANPQEIFLTDRERAAILCLIDALAQTREGKITETRSAPPIPAPPPRLERVKAPAQPALSEPD
ncbi:MAG: hypothetical protein EBS23_01820 [Betaproteobacteria bacterium]|nr:hypothetical protein [Betaproteobacteria bacterium]